MSDEKKIIGWRAWFVNPEQTEVIEYNSTEMDWSDLPNDGCVGVVVYENGLIGSNPYRQMLVGYDYYFRAESVADVGYFGDYNNERNAVDRIKRRYKNPSIKYGQWVDPTTQDRVQKAMRDARKIRMPAKVAACAFK